MPRRKKKYSDPTTILNIPARSDSSEPLGSREFMNIKQASEYLGVTISAIRGLIRTKRVPAKRIGIRFIVRRVDLEKAWESLPSI